MVQGNAILALDLGNSSTKVTVMFGRDSQTGRFREKTFDLSNVFALVEDDYEVSQDYTEENSTILRVNTSVGSNHICGNFCNGVLQEKEFPISTIKPSAFDKKWHLDATALSIRLAFLNAVQGLMSLNRVNDVSQLDITWDVIVLLPPGDIDIGKSEMEALLRNCTKVVSIMPEMSFDVNINRVTVLPEGFVAYAGVLYDKGRQFRQGYEFLKEETVMVFDVGAGTTDCMLIQDNTLVQRSKHTVEQGGNNVCQLVRNSLRCNGIDINTGDLEKGILTGEIKDGAKKISIVDDINKAKAEVAQKIVTDFQEYLSASDIKMRSVGYIITCGGGSMSDVNGQGIKPLSQTILKCVKRLSPNVEVVDLPKVKKKAMVDGVSTMVTETVSPRMLNLIGATMLAEVIYQ